MERHEGPLNSCFFGEALEVNCLEQRESLKVLEDEKFVISSLEDSMPFLQMLESVESPQFFPFKEPNFQTLVKLHHLKKPWEGIPYNYIPKLECVTNGIVESNDLQLQHPHNLASCVVEKVGYECNKKALKSGEDCSKDGERGTRERRKRTRQSKNKKDVENQRMTHIAVERNRRRQMNEHLGVLKSLMPPSYIQRGDHASIIGGAIDFVKELEQLLESLEAQKRMRKNEENGPCDYGMSSSIEKAKCGDKVKAEKKSKGATTEVTVIQKHVNLKIECQNRHGQLIKAIVALENHRLTILHLNITSSYATIIYSFDLKIEEDSKLCSANEIAEAVDKIFNYRVEAYGV